MQNNHMLWMVLACAIPLLIVFLLSLVGIKNNYIVILAMVLMIVLHLFMMKDHKHKHDTTQSKKISEKGE